MSSARSPARPAVLVVSSTVVRGAVGGRAAGFALERLGFPVWQLATVTLPWHPGHGPASRIVPDAAAFEAMVADLAGAPWLGEVGGVLSGYLGAPGQAAAIARLVDAVRAVRPDALYLCDPVLGDHGRLYVPEPTAAAIREHLAPRADILTPNPTELAFLAGRAPDERGDLAAMARSLAARRVAITSASIDDGGIETLLVADGETVAVRHRRFEGRVPNGTGDLFAALLLARLLDGCDDATALGRATAGVLAALDAAIRLGTDELPLAAMQDELSSAPRSSVKAHQPAGSEDHSAWVAGVDGCKAGWVSVVIPSQGRLDPRVLVRGHFGEVLEDGPPTEIFVIDMPIGLPDFLYGRGRGPESAVRPLLGKRAGSVFPVPSRPTLGCSTFAEAREVSRTTSLPSKSVTIFCFGLFKKMREIDSFVGSATQERIREGHPEVAFWRLNDQRPMEHSKKSALGRLERRALLVRHGFPEAFLLQRLPKVAPDDLLDAAALALIARRIRTGEAESFPREPERDARGLRMAIWA